MLTGFMLVASAVMLLVYNQKEATNAKKNTDRLLPIIMAEIESNKQETISLPGSEEHVLQDFVEQESVEMSTVEMSTVEIEGNKYIGYLSIPKLQLDLPVMADWSYPKLKESPCRYVGSVEEDNLVIMAHNYPHHFGELKELCSGDNVFFTDMNGNIVLYEIMARDVLEPVALEEVTSGAYDLTLFTCTYGGESRVTVYGNRID